MPTDPQAPAERTEREAFEALLTKYGDLNFLCGEDPEDASCEDYAAMVVRADEARNEVIAAWLASASQPAAAVAVPAEPMIRYCPECNILGMVPLDCIDCCPDGSAARVVPERFARICAATFSRLLAAPASAAVEGDARRSVTLTGAELLAAAEFVIPDCIRVVKPDGECQFQSNTVASELACGLVIEWCEECTSDEGDLMPAGYYAWIKEYPEEGRMLLSPAAQAAKEGEPMSIDDPRMYSAVHAPYTGPVILVDVAKLMDPQAAKDTP